VTLIVVRDHELRRAWIGPSYPLDLTKLPVRSEEIPLQYPSLSAFLLSSLSKLFSVHRTEVGYSSKVPFMSLEDRAALGANVEKVLLKEKDAARAPIP
jgi:DOPA 4,5-dioxygenase